MKSMLVGVLIASPVVVAWTYHSSDQDSSGSQIHPISFSRTGQGQAEGIVRIPIEVIEKGSSPKVVYVESTTDAVPEPGIFSLLAFTSLLLIFRRRRD